MSGIATLIVDLLDKISAFLNYNKLLELLEGLYQALVPCARMSNRLWSEA